MGMRVRKYDGSVEKVGEYDGSVEKRGSKCNGEVGETVWWVMMWWGDVGRSGGDDALGGRGDRACNPRSHVRHVSSSLKLIRRRMWPPLTEPSGERYSRSMTW